MELLQRGVNGRPRSPYISTQVGESDRVLL